MVEASGSTSTQPTHFVGAAFFRRNLNTGERRLDGPCLWGLFAYYTPGTAFLSERLRGKTDTLDITVYPAATWKRVRTA